jgi:hypothetical protein
MNVINTLINKHANSRRSRDDDTDEYWVFGVINDVSISSVNCCKCGNYKCSLTFQKIPDNMYCECTVNHSDNSMRVLDGDDPITNFAAERSKEMAKFESIEAFINEMTPPNERDRLCEDVVGVIISFL